jgi:Leucine-rich repeat (LRR) protein
MKSFKQFIINESNDDSVNSLIELVEGGDIELAIEVAKGQDLLYQLKLALINKYDIMFKLRNIETSDIFKAIKATSDWELPLVSNSQFKTLTVLDLEDNFITLEELPKEIGQLQKLEILFLSHNRLVKLPKEIGQLKNLKQLDLSYNSLIELPKEIGQLKNLNYLSLSYNSLVELPKEIGRLQNLKYLYIRNNFLEELPPEIGQLKNLERLYMGNNKALKKLPPEIGQLQNLKNLNVYSRSRDFPWEQINWLKSKLPNCKISH